MKNSLINKLNRDKENFQNCQKELLIIEGQVLILDSLTLHLQLRKNKTNWRDVEENWLGTPASTISGPPEPTQPTSLFDYDRDFPPLSKHILAKTLPPINLSRETSFLSLEGSSSPLRNKLPNVAPLPSRPSVNNFSRPITEISDEKNNTISITRKKTVLQPIGQRQLSQQL